MVDFTLLTGETADSLIGANAADDSFFVTIAGALAGTDTVRGGSGTGTDRLVITAPMTISGTDVANTRQIEAIDLLAGGITITLTNALVAFTTLPAFTINGSAGDDAVYGRTVLTTAMVFLASDGNDTFESGGGNDSFDGGAGNDLVNAGAGADTLRGGSGDDTMAGAATQFGAEDLLDGGTGTGDTLRLLSAGSFGPAFTARLAGIERIELAAGITAALGLTLAAATTTTDGAALTVQARDGADTIAAGTYAGPLVVLAGAGADRVIGAGAADWFDGGTEGDVLNGGAGADTLDGGDGNDRLGGGTGSDLLRGGAGDDIVSGGSGNDTIEAGAGADRLHPGTGNDLVLIAGADLTNADLIVDEAGTLDTLQLTGPAGVVFTSTLAGRVLGFERVLLGEGNDLFRPTDTFADVIEGDVLTVEGGLGADTLDGSLIARLGSPLRLLVRGGEGPDRLVGGLGNDTLDAGPGAGELLGGSGADLLIVQTADMAGAPVLNGGTNPQVVGDTLRLLGGGVLGPEVFANVAGIEVLELAAEGMEVTLPQALIAAMTPSGLNFRVVAGAGDDRVDLGALLAGRSVIVEAGEGDDSIVGGAANETVLPGIGMDSVLLGSGNDRVEFGPGQLSALDTVLADTLAGDTMVVGVAAGRVLGSSAFAGIQGIDSFIFEGGAGSAVRLPSSLVSQSGRTEVSVILDGTGGMIVDGRAIGAAFSVFGGDFDDVIHGGAGANTLSGGTGEDTLVGGDGGDAITLGNADGTRDLALYTSSTDGTGEINGTLTATELAQADRVTGLASEGNLIAIDRSQMGLSGVGGLFIGAGGDVTFSSAVYILPTAVEVGGNAFGSLSALRGALIAGGVDIVGEIGDRTVFLIGGADETEFGVYFFQDGDGNATVDSTDLLRLLAIGDTDVPTFNSGRGITVVSDLLA